MPDTILTRLRRAFNVIRYGEELPLHTILGSGSGYKPDRMSFTYNTERTTVAAVINRIGIDVAAIPLKHVRVDQNGTFQEVIQSGLNNCLGLEANVDQSGRAFIQDAVMSLCDEGVIGIVPVDTTDNPAVSGSYDILTLRTARIVQWYPQHVRLNLYNDRLGIRQDITLEKTQVAIIENPLYAVMNEPNSTLRRLIEKIMLLDAIDVQSGSGKLDLLVQVPYAVKTELKQKVAEARLQSLVEQLQDSKYGIAYIDGTEKVIQLNRPAENNLMGQVEWLTAMLWGQLGMTEEIFKGNADEEVMINYWNRTLEPIVGSILDGMARSFLTKTARTQGQTIMAIRDPFKYIPAEMVAEFADKLTRNEILTSNEFRGKLGMVPSSDPKANELRNKNLNQQAEAATEEESSSTAEDIFKDSQNGS